MANEDRGSLSAAGWVSDSGDKLGNETVNIIDPASIASGDSGRRGNRDSNASDSNRDASGRGGRGTRKRRSDYGSRRDGGAEKRQKENLDLSSFGAIIFSTHAMLATITSNQFLMISQEEATTLAQAIGNVARHYDIPGVSQQTLDWIGLIQCVGAIYGTRIIASQMARKANAAKDVTPKPELKPEEAPPPGTTQPVMPESVTIPGFAPIKPQGDFRTAA